MTRRARVRLLWSSGVLRDMRVRQSWYQEPARGGLAGHHICRSPAEGQDHSPAGITAQGQRITWDPTPVHHVSAGQVRQAFPASPALTFRPTRFECDAIKMPSLSAPFIAVLHASPVDDTLLFSCARRSSTPHSFFFSTFASPPTTTHCPAWSQQEPLALAPSLTASRVSWPAGISDGTRATTSGSP